MTLCWYHVNSCHKHNHSDLTQNDCGYKQAINSKSVTSRHFTVDFVWSLDREVAEIFIYYYGTSVRLFIENKSELGVLALGYRGDTFLVTWPEHEFTTHRSPFTFIIWLQSVSWKYEYQCQYHCILVMIYENNITF